MCVVSWAFITGNTENAKTGKRVGFVVTVYRLIFSIITGYGKQRIFLILVIFKISGDIFKMTN